ncbi:MAG: hypothetical protein JO364_01585 [Pseudonocardiales bacterium]|nr:hypothetical protein [Pseudonocardiales bacterium]
MPTARDARRGVGSAASTTATPGMDAALPLSTRTLAWLAEHPHARGFARSVWDRLTERERAGHRPDTITALRWVLVDHRPTPGGRCRACRRWRGRRRRFPCIVWHEVHGELLGLFPWGRPPLSLPSRHH